MVTKTPEAKDKKAACGRPKEPRAQRGSREGTVAKRAIKSRDIRKDLDSIDLLRAIVGVANVTSSLTGSKAREDRWRFSSWVRGL
jgi:hypothetical protein